MTGTCWRAVRGRCQSGTSLPLFAGGILFALLLAAVSGARAADIAPGGAVLTAAERAWVARNPAITMCVDPDWEPFERINEAGEHEGIAADLVRLVAQRVGLRVVLHPTRSWDESLDASRAGRCQILSFLNRTPNRDEWLLFTAPIFFDPNVVITREEHPYISDLHGISGESVALPRGTMVEERIRSLYPDLTILETGSENEAVALVSARKVDMTIRSLIVAAYTIRKEGLFNLKIAGQVPEMVNRLRIGVVKSEPMLREILDRGVATLTPREREAISNRHVSVQVQGGVDYGLVWKVVAVAAVLLLVSLYWNRKLTLLNRKLDRLSATDRLTGLCNRMKIDEILNSESRRTNRYGHPFGLIIADVDHFKEVNDRYGHPAGDLVLARIAALLKVRARETDVVGRWGGEEFILVCPQTDEPGTLKLAEDLRTALAAAPLPKAGHRTASFGVAIYRPGERIEDAVARADAALYAAKHGGRNRVCLAPPGDADPPDS